MEIRPCTQESIRQLERLGRSPAEMAHHRERWAWQEQGVAVYLLAWRDGQDVGRTTPLKESKYETVRSAFPGIWAMNALEARPQGRGVGTLLITAAEQRAAESGCTVLGLAVGPENLRARALYERLGYVEWRRGRVIDVWDECDDAGRVVRAHADECVYLVKRFQPVRTGRARPS